MDARQRMASQSPQREKTAAADVVIENNGSFEDTWKQVQKAWQKLFPYGTTGDTLRIPADKVRAAAEAARVDLSTAALEIDRAKPRQAQEIADFINRMTGTTGLSRMDVMAAFGEKAYMLLYADDQLAGVVGWQVENLVARIDEIWMEGTLNISKALRVMAEKIESASKELQAEAILAFVDPEQAADTTLWQPMGYQILTIPQLEVNAWQEAARESQPPDTLILFKQLRIDRILRPI
jgi:dephospho-CoA kinase